VFFPILMLGIPVITGLIAAKAAVTAGTAAVPVGLALTKKELKRQQRLGINIERDNLAAISTAKSKKAFELRQHGKRGLRAEDVKLTEAELAQALKIAGGMSMVNWEDERLRGFINLEGRSDEVRARFEGKYFLTNLERDLLLHAIQQYELVNEEGEDAAFLREVAAKADVPYHRILDTVNPVPLEIDGAALRELSQRRLEDERLVKTFLDAMAARRAEEVRKGQQNLA
jgi:hypothetical protein